jgi:trigger factor
MVSRHDIDSTSALLTVSIPREQIKDKLDAELKKFRQRAAIKGFRQGQAPMEYVKKMYGQAMFADMLNDVMAKELYDYLRESGLDILGQPLPTLDQENFTMRMDTTDPEYAVKYEIGYVPAFEIQGLDTSETFERLTISNLDELAEEDLKHARQRMGQRTSAEDDIQDNDVVRIAARELDGDQPKAGGWEATMPVLLKDITDEGFRSDLLQRKKGDTIRFNARSLEAQASADDHYRKYILQLGEDDPREVNDWFEGTIEEVSRVGEAELNEEFFQGYFNGKATNREEAIEELKRGIERYFSVRSNALLMRSFQQRLMERNPIELPESFLKRWLLATNSKELTPDTVDEEYPAFAENLRWSLLRDKIKAKFGLEVTDEELRQEYFQRVRNYFQVELPDNVLEGSVARLMKNEKDVEDTRRDLESDKIFEAIRSQVTVVDKPVTSEEFVRLLEEVTKGSV